MTHIAARPSRGAGVLVRMVYWLARRRLGRVPRPIAIAAHHRGVLAGVGAFELAMERSHCVPATLKALVCIKGASLVGCRFCIDIGSSEALRHGLSEAKLLALVSFESSELFSEQERMALRLTEQMTVTPAAPAPALVRALEAEFGRAGLVELIAMIAWENYRARFNHAVGAEEEGYADKRVCAFPPRVAEAQLHRIARPVEEVPGESCAQHG